MTDTINTKLELRKKRTFSEMISFTFDFIRVNYKIILKSFAIFGLPLILIGSYLLFGFIQNAAMNIGSGFGSSIYGKIGLAYVFLLAGGLFYAIAINVIIAQYANMEDPSKIKISDVWNGILKNLGSYIGASLLIGIIVVIAFFIILIPGIYLSIALSFVFFIITFENKSVGSAFDRSFKLIKGNWWSTFGFILLMSVIQVLINYTITLPLSFLSIWLSEPLMSSPDIESQKTIGSIILTIISSVQILFYSLISCIIYIAIAVKYFSIVEEKENIGLRSQIESMGKTDESAEL